MERILPLVLIGGLLAWVAGLFGPDKRARSLRKARAAKKRYARSRRVSGRRRTTRSRPVRTRARPRTGRKLTKAERRAISLRNLAKARRARRKK